MGREKTQQAKLSFSAGVLSPRLSLRSDGDVYSTGLRYATNFIVSPQGGIIMREGLQNFGLISFPTEPNRIFQFHKGGTESDFIVAVSAGDGFIYFYEDGVLQPYTLAHDYQQSELEALYFTNQENTAVLNHADYPPFYIDIDLNGVITGEYFPADLVPLADYDDERSPTATTTGDAQYIVEFVDATDSWQPSRNWLLKYDGVWATGNQGNPKEYEYSQVSSILINRLTKALNSIPALIDPDTQVGIVPVGTPDATMTYEITITGKGGGKVLELEPANSSSDKYVNVTPTVDINDVLEPAWSYPAYVLHGGIYYQCILAHTPELVTNEPPNATYWTPLAGKPETFDWQYPDGNAWSATAVHYSPQDRGFPTVGVVHQQRLILMANPGFTMGVFGSRINKYRDFTQGPEDDDPFFFAIDTSDTPTIKWAESQQNLILGTSGGDYRLTAQVTLSPSDIQALKQNNARSNTSKAVTVNTDILYIEQGKEKIRSTGYRNELNAQTSHDISIIAEHLFNSRVKRLALMQTPEVLVFGLREDGSLVCLSYSAETKQVAWFEFVSQGEIIDIAIAYTITTDEDELWATITYDNGVSHHLEKMPYPKRVFTAAEEETDDFLVDQDLVCLDSWIKGQIVIGDNNVITGLDQYEGLTVAAMVNDAWTGTYVVNDGALILNSAGVVDKYEGTYAVGITYTATAETFEMATGNWKGIAFGTQRRWNRLVVKTLDSALPKINGELPPDRNPVVQMGIPDLIQEGLTDNEMRALGFGDGSVNIIQDRPYPTQILGVFGEFNANND